LEAAGFSPEDYSDEDCVFVWPENAKAFNLFAILQTQWRVGAAGPTGLDYCAMHDELNDLGVTGQERQWLKEDIRLMEAAALRMMRAR
jgi:hypothetical protein